MASKKTLNVAFRDSVDGAILAPADVSDAEMNVGGSPDVFDMILLESASVTGDPPPRVYKPRISVAENILKNIPGSASPASDRDGRSFSRMRREARTGDNTNSALESTIRGIIDNVSYNVLYTSIKDMDMPEWLKVLVRRFRRKWKLVLVSLWERREQIDDSISEDVQRMDGFGSKLLLTSDELESVTLASDMRDFIEAVYECRCLVNDAECQIDVNSSPYTYIMNIINQNPHIGGLAAEFKDKGYTRFRKYVKDAIREFLQILRDEKQSIASTLMERGEDDLLHGKGAAQSFSTAITPFFDEIKSTGHIGSKMNQDQLKSIPTFRAMAYNNIDPDTQFKNKYDKFEDVLDTERLRKRSVLLEPPKLIPKPVKDGANNDMYVSQLEAIFNSDISDVVHSIKTFMKENDIYPGDLKNVRIPQDA